MTAAGRLIFIFVFPEVVIESGVNLIVMVVEIVLKAFVEAIGVQTCYTCGTWVVFIV